MENSIQQFCTIERNLVLCTIKGNIYIFFKLNLKNLLDIYVPFFFLSDH